MTSTSRAVIAKDYLSLWFWIDLLASFPFEVLLPSADEDPVEFVVQLVNESGASQGGSTNQVKGGSNQVNKLGRLGKIFRMLRIFKLLRLFKLGRIMKRMKSLTEGNPNVVTLVRTLCLMGFILHLTACS